MNYIHTFYHASQNGAFMNDTLDKKTEGGQRKRIQICCIKDVDAAKVGRTSMSIVNEIAERVLSDGLDKEGVAKLKSDLLATA